MFLFAYDLLLSVLPSANTTVTEVQTPNVPAYSALHVLGLPKGFQILQSLCPFYWGGGKGRVLNVAVLCKM